MRGRVAIGIAAAVMLGACGGGRSSTSARAEQVRAAAGQAGLPVAVQDFMASAVSSAGQSYRVTYALGDRTATVVQRPPWRRLDLEGSAGDGQSYVVNSKGTFSCQRPPGGAWSCQPDSQPPPAAGALSLDDAAAAVTSLTQSAAAYDMRVENRSVAGTDASCLVATPKAASNSPETLCISRTGVPLLIEGGVMGQGVRATKYHGSASASDFKLPAPARSG